MRNCIPAPAVGRRLTWSRHPEPRRRRRISSAEMHRILRSFAALRMTNTSPSGGMADAVDSKSTALWGMPVRVRPRAPQKGAASRRVLSCRLSVLNLQTTDNRELTTRRSRSVRPRAPQKGAASRRVAGYQLSVLGLQTTDNRQLTTRRSRSKPCVDR